MKPVALLAGILLVAAAGAFPADASFFDSQNAPDGQNAPDDHRDPGGTGDNWRVVGLRTGRPIDGVEVGYVTQDGTISVELTPQVGDSPIVLLPPHGFFNDAINVGVVNHLSAKIMVETGAAVMEIALIDEPAMPVLYDFGMLEESSGGYQTYVWQNPHYIDDIRNRELRLSTLREPSAYRRRVAAIVLRPAATPFTVRIQRLGIRYDRAVFEGPPW